MRPLKLTMTAFGPYAAEEVIDFTKLKDRNIFLITGPTGAGKTTIFDGISFAVFGNASSEERDGENLRSHFAKEDILTSVELDFELKGIKYNIKRIPKQQKKKTKGEGFTEQKSEAFLKFGESYVSGVTAVNEKIGDILGISYDQFRQIIMIPQGEFRKLITADSQDREKILQKIFGTQGYRRVQDKLWEKERALNHQAEELSNRIDENLHSIDCGNNEKLIELLSAAKINRDQVQKEIDSFVNQDSELEEAINRNILVAEKKSGDKSKEIFTAQENNKKFQVMDVEKAEKAELEKMLPEIEAKQQKLVKARKALNLAGLEENLENKVKVEKIKEQELFKAQKLSQEAENNLKSTEKNYYIQKESQPLRDRLLQEQAVLNGFKDKVISLEEKGKSIRQLELRLLELDKTVKDIKLEIENDKENIKKLNDELIQSRAAKDKYHESSAMLERKNIIQEKFKAILNQNHKLTSIREHCKDERDNFGKIKETYDELKAEYENLQELFFKGQAGFLSAKLILGEPCPVCGSKSHPSPADTIEGIPDEDKLKDYKGKLSTAQIKYNESSEKYSKFLGEGKAQKEFVDKLKGELEQNFLTEIMPLEKEMLDIKVQKLLKQLNIEINALTLEIAEAAKLKEKEEKLTEILDKTTKSLDQKGNQYEAADKLSRDTYALLSTEKGLFDSIKEELPQNMDSIEKLYTEIKAKEIEFNDLKKAFETSEKAYRQAQVEYEKCRTLKDSSNNNFMEASEELKLLENKFNLEVKAAGFEDVANYKENKLTQDNVDLLDKSINEFREHLKSAGDSLLKAEKDIEGLKVIEITELEKQLLDINLEKENLNKKKTEVYARRMRNFGIMKSLKNLKNSLEKIEEEYKIVGNLANIARGKNSENITFERYVLAAFFDDIIDAANLRLTKITGNRYEMSRIKEKSKGNAQSGLELEVLDNYTGRSRHVKTLSGGESFKASLSLALGLADVVQCYAGGISLDTMFIDEGFGTLDPESLDSAIQSLIDLQDTGRLVGIISHVPELKERIDARLEIVPSKEGSTTVFKL